MPQQRGFALATPEERRKHGAKGGKTSHARGRAHKLTEDELRRGGKTSGGRQPREHMSKLGKAGAAARWGSKEKAE